MEQTAQRRLSALFAISTVIIVLWIVLAGDPCLLPFLRGSQTLATNRMTITECNVAADGTLVITVGDVIVRLASLALLMWLFGLVATERGIVLRKRKLAAIVSAGATAAFALYLATLYGLVPSMDISPFHGIYWVGAVCVASASVAAGVSLAKPRPASSPLSAEQGSRHQDTNQ